MRRLNHFYSSSFYFPPLLFSSSLGLWAFWQLTNSGEQSAFWLYFSGVTFFFVYGGLISFVALYRFRKKLIKPLSKVIQKDHLLNDQSNLEEALIEEKELPIGVLRDLVKSRNQLIENYSQERRHVQGICNDLQDAIFFLIPKVKSLRLTLPPPCCLISQPKSF